MNTTMAAAIFDVASWPGGSAAHAEAGAMKMVTTSTATMVMSRRVLFSANDSFMLFSGALGHLLVGLGPVVGNGHKLCPIVVKNSEANTSLRHRLHPNIQI